MPFISIAPEILALLISTALAAGLSRGFSGFGAALIFMPVVSRLVGPQVAAAILLLVDTVLAAPLIARAWREADRQVVGQMMLGGLAGIPLGSAILAWSDAMVMRWLIAVMVALMLVLLLSGWRYSGGARLALTVIVGTISGIFSGAAQIGGPPVVAYWLGGAAAAITARASIILFFAGSSAVSVVSYAASGMLTREVIHLSLLVAPAYGAGLLIGSRLFNRFGEGRFRPMSLALIALAVVLGLPVWG
jgi:uncharacterized membrane protein YfcA